MKQLTVKQLEAIFDGIFDESTHPMLAIAEYVHENFFPKPASNKPKADTWIDDWIALFPPGVRSGGKFLRSDKKECLRKMNAFMKEYGYEKGTIFDATEAYLRDRELSNYMYTKCATYFISKKDEGSTLAEWCSRLEKPDSDLSEIHNSTGYVNDFI